VAVQEPTVGAAAPAQVQEAAQGSDAVPAAKALQPTTANTELLKVPGATTPVLEVDETPAATTAVQSGGRTGLGFMIAGGAALVAGLLIGGTTGDVIAVGGAVLGVWGIIIYF
jgi:hypothetical protein